MNPKNTRRGKTFALALSLLLALSCIVLVAAMPSSTFNFFSSPTLANNSYQTQIQTANFAEPSLLTLTMPFADANAGQWLKVDSGSGWLRGDGDTPVPASPPLIHHASVHPDKVLPGDVMTVTAEVSSGTGIISVTADMGGIETISLRLLEGSAHNGTWQADWRSRHRIPCLCHHRYSHEFRWREQLL